MVFVRRHPIVISLLPPLRSSGLDGVVLAHCFHRLCLSLGSRAKGLQLRQAYETVVVLVTKIQDAAAVATALANVIPRAYGVEQEPATTFIEGDDSGVDVHAGLHEAALD